MYNTKLFATFCLSLNIFNSLNMNMSFSDRVFLPKATLNRLLLFVLVNDYNEFNKLIFE